MGRKVAFRRSVRLHSRLIRPFSDSFKAKFSEQVFWVVGKRSDLRASVLARRSAHRFTATTVKVSAFVGGVRNSKTFACTHVCVAPYENSGTYSPTAGLQR
jgi:hypothetical protein